MLDQQQDQHVKHCKTTETQYSIIIYKVVSKLASLIRPQEKDYHHQLVCISHQLHPNSLYGMHLFGDTKNVFFRTSKLLLFCISLSCVDVMLYFPFFSKYLSLLPPAFHNFHTLLRHILSDLFIPPLSLFSSCTFLCPPTSYLCSRK